MVLNKPEQNGKLVIYIESTLHDGKHGMKALPGLIKMAIKDGAWKEYYSETLRQIVHHETFEAFLTKHPPDGLGSTVDQIKSICHADTEALDAIDQALQHKPGKTWDSRTTENTVDNIQGNKAPTGTSAARSLRKLRTDAPEIHTRVLAGELSPNAGMLEAGFRKKTCTVELSVEGFARYINAHFDAEERETLSRAIVGELPNA